MVSLFRGFLQMVPAARSLPHHSPLRHSDTNHRPSLILLWIISFIFVAFLVSFIFVTFVWLTVGSQWFGVIFYFCWFVVEKIGYPLVSARSAGGFFRRTSLCEAFAKFPCWLFTPDQESLTVLLPPRINLGDPNCTAVMSKELLAFGFALSRPPLYWAAAVAAAVVGAAVVDWYC